MPAMPTAQAPVDPTVDLFAEIERLKRERKAVILAHYYQDPDIQDIADHLGDSLELAKRARDAKDAEVILFCGVHFMAETAKIVNPQKIVIIPDLKAGCSLAEQCPADQLRAWKQRHPEHYVVMYINCSAATKAESDIICTSSNAEKIIRSVPEGRPILFGPDKNLGAFLVKKTGRQMDLWSGACMVHETFSSQKIAALKARHPDAKFIAHPECEDHVLLLADFVGSTSKLLEFVQKDGGRKYIVGTETGILHTMHKAAPDKELIPVPYEDRSAACQGCNACPHMKLNTLEKIFLALRDLQPRIEMPEDLRRRALLPLERMLAIS
ncbi:MAG: quinolinate synthase NadA [Planctomycetes bacterium]|nr:quinolinate synthase NadA [Planctomycetota bacterium]